MNFHSIKNSSINTLKTCSNSVFYLVIINKVKETLNGNKTPYCTLMILEHGLL